MKTLLKKMKLDEAASEDAAVAHYETILNRATTAEENLKKITAERDGLLNTQVEADLEKFKGVITNRETVKKALLANRTDTIALMESLKPAAPEGGEGADRKPITNRATAKTPAEIAAEDKRDSEEAAKIRNRCSDLQAKGMEYRKAHEQAVREIRGA